MLLIKVYFLVPLLVKVRENMVATTWLRLGVDCDLGLKQANMENGNGQ